MGFKDVDWAYSLSLPMVQKTVLAAICHRTDDKTHQTLVGQKTIAEMAGASEKTVQRAVGALETMGVLTRRQRHGKGGYRTSDEITVNTTYRSDSPQGSQPTRQTAQQADSPDLTDSQSRPTGLSDRAEDINQIDQPEDQPDTPGALEVYLENSRSFEDFYSVWPQKKKRPDAQKAWNAAIKRATPQQIYDASVAYANNPHRPAKQFIPYPASWLRADGWNDELEGPPERERNTMTRGEKNLAYVQQLAAQEAAQARGIAS